MRLGVAPLDPRWLGDTAGGGAAACHVAAPLGRGRRSCVGMAGCVPARTVWKGGRGEASRATAGLAQLRRGRAVDAAIGMAGGGMSSKGKAVTVGTGLHGCGFARRSWRRRARPAAGWVGSAVAFRTAGMGRSRSGEAAAWFVGAVVEMSWLGPVSFGDAARRGRESRGGHGGHGSAWFAKARRSRFGLAGSAMDARGGVRHVRLWSGGCGKAAGWLRHG
jgi:hypothetical protein